MKTRKLEMQYQEGQQTMRGKALGTVALFGVLLGAPQDGLTQNISGVNDGALTTGVVKKDTMQQKITMMPSSGIKVQGDDGALFKLQSEDGSDDGVSIEPDPDDKDKGTLPEDSVDQTKEKSDSGVSLSRQTGVGYSVTGGEALWVNRFVGSGTLFKGKLGEVSVTGIADLDNPLHTVGSGKLILGKSLYKGLSLDGDYTFTGTGDNVMRFGMGYGGKLGDGSYGVRLFPLNTNGSPMSAKVSFSTKVGKNGSLSSFVFVDFDTKGYYSETEYIHQLAQGVAAFVQARLMGTMDGKFTGADGQILMGGLKIDL